MMMVYFWDKNDNCVARFCAVANTSEEAIAYASAKYSVTPNAEFKPLDTLSVTTESC